MQNLDPKSGANCGFYYTGVGTRKLETPVTNHHFSKGTNLHFLLKNLRFRSKNLLVLTNRTDRALRLGLNVINDGDY